MERSSRAWAVPVACTLAAGALVWLVWWSTGSDCPPAERRALLVAQLAEYGRPSSARMRAELARRLGAAECEHGVDALLLLALAQQESGVNPRARGAAGGVGLLQIRPVTGQAIADRLGVPWHGEQTLLDPGSNVDLGAAYLAALFEEFGSWEAALAAYNLGPTRLRRLVRQGQRPTSPYARRILARQRKLAGSTPQ